MVLSIRCTASFVYVVEKFLLYKYSKSLLDCSKVDANQLVRSRLSALLNLISVSVVFTCFQVGATGCIVSVAWNLDGTKLAVLSNSNVLVMFDLVSSQILWRAPISVSTSCLVNSTVIFRLSFLCLRDNHSNFNNVFHVVIHCLHLNLHPTVALRYIGLRNQLVRFSKASNPQLLWELNS